VGAGTYTGGSATLSSASNTHRSRNACIVPGSPGETSQVLDRSQAGAGRAVP